MSYTDLIFDLYGTLVDIHTEEDDPVWVHFTIDRCCGNRACIVRVLNLFLYLSNRLCKSVSLNKTSELVLCEAINVRSGKNIGNYHRACISLGKTGNFSIDNDAGVLCLKSIDLSLELFINSGKLGYKHLNVVCTVKIGILVFTTGITTICVVIASKVTGSKAGKNHHCNEDERYDSTHFHKSKSSLNKNKIFA